MAIIKNILGTITGRIGDIVVRTVNGKSVASVRPSKYNASQSSQAVFNRNRFSVTVSFAKYVNFIPLLSKVWSTARIQGVSAFNKILKCNVKLSGKEHPSECNIITPSGYTIELNEVEFEKDFISIEVCREIKFAETQCDYCVIIVFAFYQPLKQGISHFVMSHSVKQLKMPGQTSLIRISLDDNQKQFRELYSYCNIYVAEIIESQKHDKPVWSSSVTRTISFD